MSVCCSLPTSIFQQLGPFCPVSDSIISGKGCVVCLALNCSSSSVKMPLPPLGQSGPKIHMATVIQASLLEDEARGEDELVAL